MNHHYRQFLQYLRGGDWMPASDLLDKPRIKKALLDKGWMERRGAGGSLHYRVTSNGLLEMKKPVRDYTPDL
jgi:hypothetical protein